MQEKIIFTIIIIIHLIYNNALFSQVENRWVGTSSSLWTNPNNWTQNHVPWSNENVLIGVLPGSSHYPSIQSGDSVVCFDINIQGELTINGTLEVFRDFEAYGGEVTLGFNGKIIVNDDVFWNAGSTADVNHSSSSNAEIIVYDDWNFGLSSNVELDRIWVYMVGSSPSKIVVKSPDSSFDKLFLLKNNDEVEFSNSSTHPLKVEDLVIGNTTHTLNTFISNSDQNIIINNSIENGSNMELNDGTLVFYDGSDLHFYSGDYVNNVHLYTTFSETVTFTGDPLVKGDLVAYTISGTLAATDLRIEGDFDNTISHNLSLGHVIFEGDKFQDVYRLTCDVLEVNKTGGEMRVPAYNVWCNSYDWTQGFIRVNGGVLTADDLVDNGLYGTISVTSGQINFTQDVSQFVDLRGYIFMTGGSFIVNGGQGRSYWPYLTPATIIMSGGVLSFSRGININTTAFLTSDITGGEIQTKGGFEINRSDFQPTGGTITLYNTLSGQDSVIISHQPNSNFYNLKISKAPMYEVVTNSDIDINGDLEIISGRLESDDHIHIAGDWTSSNSFVEDGGFVTFDGTADQNFNGLERFENFIIDNDLNELYISPFSILEIDTFNWEGGTFRIDESYLWIYDIYENSIYGSYILENDGDVAIYQDSEPGSKVDFNANVTITHPFSNMKIYGGSGTSSWGNFTDFSITITDGHLEFLDNGITIHNSHLFTEAISGGTISCEGGFTSWRNDFTPSGGKVFIWGGNDVDIRMQPGSYFYDLEINNVSNPPGSEGSVTALTDLVIKNHFELKGGTFEPLNMTVGGNWINAVGPDAFIEGTYEVEFDGSYSGIIVGNETFYDISINKTAVTNEALGINSDDTVQVNDDCVIHDGRLVPLDNTLLIVKDNLSILNGAGLNTSIGNGVKVEVGGDWINNATSVSDVVGFKAGNSIVELNGYGDQDVEQHHRSGSFFDLYIENHDYDVHLNEPMKVENDLTIIKGTLISPDTLWIGGDWNNQVGSANFNEGSDFVIFYGNGSSQLINNEAFYNVIVDKTYTGFNGFQINSSINMDVLNDLEIKLGTVEMNNNSSLDVDGNLTIRPNAGLNADDSNLRIYIGGDYYDENSAWSSKIGFNPGTSRVTFDGLVSQTVYSAAADGDFYHLIIDKPSDVLSEDFVLFLSNMKILGDAQVVDGRWYDFPSGAFTHEFHQGLTVDAGGKWYGGDGTIIFKSVNDQKWTPSSIFTDCFFHNIIVDKPSGTIFLYNDTQSINGAFLLVNSGILDLNGYDLYIAGDGEIKSEGELRLSGGGELIIGNHQK